MLLPLTDGFYTARSVLASAQRCVNLYGERNPKSSPFPFTFYPRPGLTALSPCPQPGAGRALYTASNGDLYALVGPNLYYVTPEFVFAQVGTVADAGKTLQTPGSMADNGNDVVLVDGTQFGYSVAMPTRSFGLITDPNFLGGQLTDFLDTYLLFNEPNTENFYTSLSNSLTFDPLYFAGKSGWPDNLAGLIVVHREIWLLGLKTTEVWGDAGAAQFPFQPLGGVFIQRGCIAPYSIKAYDLFTFWLGQDKSGQGQIFMGRAYNAVEIGTPAVVHMINSYPRIDDAVGMVFQMEDHAFYVLTFPTADKTWAYDISTGLWSEWVSIDTNGAEHRHRAGAMAYAYGANLALDWQTGTLYRQDLGNFNDDTIPLVFRRGFPHLINLGKRVSYYKFVADMQTGTILNTLLMPEGADDFSNDFGSDFGGTDVAGIIPQVSLRWSDDRGITYGNPVSQSLGATGQSKLQPAWRRLGYGRDRVFELFWSGKSFTALNGAFVDAVPLGS